MVSNSGQFLPVQPLGNAADLAERWQSRLQPFWQQMTCAVLTTPDQVQLSYYCHLVPGAKNAVLISSGRMEMAVKYAELCFELVQAGYSVFLLDHRGQGLSQRELSNPHKGYIADFKLYQADLAQFVGHVVMPSGHQRYIALGHSMGCAILAGYLQQYSHPFSAAIFASPMLGIYTGLVPARLAESIALAFGALNRAVTPEPWYFPGQSNYQEKAFSNNPLTSCAARYEWLLQRYREQPQAQLGGVTTRWVSAAIRAMRQLQLSAGQWRTPLLLLQAEADKVVSNHAQNLWYRQLPATLQHQLVKLPQARHEIFMETDDIRAQALNAINSFLATLPPQH